MDSQITRSVGLGRNGRVEYDYADMMKKRKLSLGKNSKVLSFLILFTLLASGCSSQSPAEDSDEFKMNQYYDCIQRYMNKGIYSSTEIENICRVLLP